MSARWHRTLLPLLPAGQLPPGEGCGWRGGRVGTAGDRGRGKRVASCAHRAGSWWTEWGNRAVTAPCLVSGSGVGRGAPRGGGWQGLRRNHRWHHPAPLQGWGDPPASSQGRGAGRPHPTSSCTPRDGASEPCTSLQGASPESWGICADHDCHRHIPARGEGAATRNSSRDSTTPPPRASSGPYQ